MGNTRSQGQEEEECQEANKEPPSDIAHTHESNEQRTCVANETREAEEERDKLRLQVRELERKKKELELELLRLDERLADRKAELAQERDTRHLESIVPLADIEVQMSATSELQTSIKDENIAEELTDQKESVPLANFDSQVPDASSEQQTSMRHIVNITEELTNIKESVPLADFDFQVPAESSELQCSIRHIVNMVEELTDLKESVPLANFDSQVPDVSSEQQTSMRHIVNITEELTDLKESVPLANFDSQVPDVLSEQQTSMRHIVNIAEELTDLKESVPLANFDSQVPDASSEQQTSMRHIVNITEELTDLKESVPLANFDSQVPDASSEQQTSMRHIVNITEELTDLKESVPLANFDSQVPDASSEQQTSIRHIVNIAEEFTDLKESVPLADFDFQVPDASSEQQTSMRHIVNIAEEFTDLKESVPLADFDFQVPGASSQPQTSIKYENMAEELTNLKESVPLADFDFQVPGASSKPQAPIKYENMTEELSDRKESVLFADSEAHVPSTNKPWTSINEMVIDLPNWSNSVPLPDADGDMAENRVKVITPQWSAPVSLGEPVLKKPRTANTTTAENKYRTQMQGQEPKPLADPRITTSATDPPAASHPATANQCRPSEGLQALEDKNSVQYRQLHQLRSFQRPGSSVRQLKFLTSNLEGFVDTLEEIDRQFMKSPLIVSAVCSKLEPYILSSWSRYAAQHTRRKRPIVRTMIDFLHQKVAMGFRYVYPYTREGMFNSQTGNSQPSEVLQTLEDKNSLLYSGLEQLRAFQQPGSSIRLLQGLTTMLEGYVSLLEMGDRRIMKSPLIMRAVCSKLQPYILWSWSEYAEQHAQRDRPIILTMLDFLRQKVDMGLRYAYPYSRAGMLNTATANRCQPNQVLQTPKDKDSQQYVGLEQLKSFQRPGSSMGQLKLFTYTLEGYVDSLETGDCQFVNSPLIMRAVCSKLEPFVLWSWSEYAAQHAHDNEPIILTMLDFLREKVDMDFRYVYPYSKEGTLTSASRNGKRKHP